MYGLRRYRETGETATYIRRTTSEFVIVKLNRLHVMLLIMS